MKQSQNNFRKDKMVKMKRSTKIIIVYVIVTVMLFLLCGCQSKSKKNNDNIVMNDIEEKVSDEQITEDIFDDDISDNKQNNLNSNSEQTYFNDETSDDETDTQTSNSNTSSNTSKPSTNTGNSKPSTSTQNTQSSTNNTENNTTTNESEENSNTNTNTNNSTPNTNTETSKPTETTPEQPQGTLIEKYIYGCGSEHTKVVRGITFHWYDRYEKRSINGEVSKSIDFTSLNIRFEKETDPLYASKTNDKFCFDYVATASHKTSVWLRTYDSEEYFLEEILLYINTDHNIQGKSRGTMWCRDINMYIDATNEIYPPYVELYPAL